MGEDLLRDRLAGLADAAPAPSAGLSSAVRTRARVRRRRRSLVQAAAAVAAVGVLAPLPGLLTGGDARDRLVVAGEPEPPEPSPASPSPSPSPDPPPPPPAQDRVVATFSFPQQAAVAELLLPQTPVAPGVPVTVTVRVRTERGRPGGVDLSFGDERRTFLSGTPRCTPDAGPTVVDLRAEHVWTAPGDYVVRAAPQVLSGCTDGRGLLTAAGATPAEAVVQVGGAPAGAEDVPRSPGAS